MNLGKSILKIEKIIKELEDPDISLEKSYKLTQECTELINKCVIKIDDYEKKFEDLISKLQH